LSTREQKELAINTQTQPVSSHHLQQQELVAFLYSRFSLGTLITLFVASVASMLVYIELSIQGREHWVALWFALFCAISFARWRLLRRFQGIRNKSYFPYQQWHNRFFIGVVAGGGMLGCGAALSMPFITTNVQIILHSLLLGMGAGAIAYLSTSLRIYIAYLVTIMLPVTIWLFLQDNPDTYVLSFLYLFFMIAGSISVKRMNILVNDALYYRYDNETLIEDLERLLESVSQTNKALEKISTTDELTGISNYRAFRVHLEDVWRQSRANQAPLSLIRINIDYYHEFNAHYGQEAGDRYLRDIAQILNDQVSHKSHMVARLQGAEFALLLPGMSCDAARQIAEEVMRRLAEKKIEHVKSRAQGYLTISVGLGCQAVTPGSSSRELLLRADTALKLAKAKGRNRLEVLEA